MPHTYQRIGNEFLVNSTTAGRQRADSVTYLSSGGFVITWVDEAGPNFMEIRAQLYDPSGTPVGGEFLVNSSSTNDQEMSSVTALASGGFLVTWTDNSGAGGDADTSAIKAQIFDAAGAKVGGEFLVNTDTAGGQRLSDAVQLDSGDILITWDSAGDIKAQLFTSGGVKIGGEFPVNTTTAGTQLDPAVAALSSGGFVISWTDFSGQPDDTNAAVRAQIFDVAGVKVGAEFLVNTTTSGDQQQTDVAGLASGGFVIVWEDFGGHAWAQIFDASGTKSGGEISLETVAGSSQSKPKVSALAFGGFAITWSESGKDGSFGGIILQVFDATGGKLGTEMVVNQTTDNIQDSSVITTLPSGDVVISWSDFSGVGGDMSQIGVKAQIVRPLLQGTEGGDALTGTAGDDAIAGLGGNDTLDGSGGDDVLIGGSGDDIYVVGSAGDIITESADQGIDTVRTDLASYSLAALAEVENLTGGAGDQSLTGNGQNNVIDGGAGADTMTGGGGHDVYIVDNLGDVVIEADGAGTDEVRTGLGSKTAPAYAVYVIPDFVENLTGTSTGAQGVRDNALNNVIVMAGGHDLIVADAGGVDSVDGGGGNDFIYYGATLTAADTTNGGSGVDTVGLLGNYASGITFSASNLVGVERLALYTGGGGFSYSITMNDANVAAGGDFFVTAASLTATETLFFNGAAETEGRFTVLGGSGGDTIIGGLSSDYLAGNAGNDLIYGLNGTDFILGGLGADQLRGGGGADYFRYQSTAQSTTGSIDQILDFTHSDRIDLSAIDADGNAGNGETAFTFVGGNAFSNTAGELRATESGGVWTVEGDTNGDGVADLIIHVTLTGLVPLGAGDFIL